MHRLLAALAVLAAAITAAPDDARAAVVAQYHLDGSYADSSGNGATGTSPTGAFVADGRWGGAFDAVALRDGFDVATAPRLEPASAVTLAVWVRRDSRAGSERVIVGKLRNGCGDVSYGLRTTEEESAPVFTVATQGGAGSSSVTARSVDVWDGRWHALAGTYDGTTTRIYVDGTLRGSTAVTGGPLRVDYAGSTDRRLQAARHTLPGLPVCNPSDTSFRGQLDELRVYDQALTAAQVARLQDPAATSPPTTLDPPVVTPTPVPTAAPTVAPTAAPPAPAFPSLSAVNTALPAITKTSRVSATTTRHTCSPGTWTGLASVPGVQFSWLRARTAGGPPTEVATGATIDVDGTGAGYVHTCRVSVLAASGQRVTALSPSKVLYGTFATNPDAVPQQVVGNVRVRGIDVLQTTQPSSGATQFRPGPIGFAARCGGGTPTNLSFAFFCVALPSTAPASVRYDGVDLDYAKAASAVVYLDRFAGSTATAVDVRLSGGIQGGDPFFGAVTRTTVPQSIATGDAVTATDRDDERAGILVPIPQSWLAQAAESGSKQLRLAATVTLAPTAGQQVECLALADLCAADNDLRVTNIPVEPGMYIVDVRSVRVLKKSQTPGKPGAITLADPRSVLAGAVRQFPAGDELRISPYVDDLEVDLDAVTKFTGCGVPPPNETLQQANVRVRACRSDKVFAALEAYRKRAGNASGYDVLMGVHRYDVEPGTETGDLTPATRVGTQPIFHVNDGSLGRPLTAGAHEFGHALGLPHADVSCGGGGGPWPPDGRGRLQGVAFEPASGRRRVDGVAGDLYDLMSYCEGTTDAKAHLSPFNWNVIQRTLLQLAAKPPKVFTEVLALGAAHAGEPSGHVVGYLAGGEAVITDVEPTGPGNVPVLPDPASPLRVGATDAAGASLGEVGAVVTQTRDGGGATFIAPLPKGAAAVEVRAGQTVVGARRASKPPVVRVRSPRRGARVRRSLTVRWRSADPDTKDRRATVEYSPGGGAPFRSVFTGADTGRAVVPAARLATGKRARVRVRISDGFGVAEATSAPFVAAGTPPQARIVSPAPGTRVAGGVATVLVGQATDDAGRRLPGRALQWFAGRRRIGRGARLETTLPAGRTRVRLVARDRGGRRGTATRAVRVEGSPLRLTTLTAPARVARGARRVRVRVAATARTRLRAGGRSFQVGPKARTIRVPLPRKPRSGVLRLPLTAGGLRTTLTVVRL